MPDYHIGTLDEAGRKGLSEGEVTAESSEPRPVFLDSRTWNKAILHSKKIVSWDTRIFTFKIDHEDQLLGLPTGKHLMMRLRDPATREAIIRSYTPISESDQKGYIEVLVKVYFDTKERRGGKMTSAMDHLPIGHYIDFKGPIGKFEYLGKGLCDINGAQRNVKRFIMISGGSGITPIFQVYRAVMQDKDDTTHCTILNSNRLVEDILCRQELDQFAEGNDHKCKLLYTLTKAADDWLGLRGRINAEFLKQHAPYQPDTMVLICGPEALEKTAHIALGAMGWPEEDLLFF